MDKKLLLKKTSSFFTSPTGSTPKKSTPDLLKDRKNTPDAEKEDEKKRKKASSRLSRGRKKLPLNTYQLEPSVPFRVEPVHDLMQRVLQHFLADSTLVYDPYLCAELCLYMSGLIRDLVKKFKFDRYKIVSLVEIVENNKQGVRTISHCLWDNERDAMVTVNFEATTFTCAAALFALYTE